MRIPKFRIRTLMIVVVVAAMILVPIVRGLHLHDFYVSFGRFTIRF